MLKKNSRKWNLVLVLICILLLGVIFFLFSTNQKKILEVSQRVEIEEKDVKPKISSDTQKAKMKIEPKQARISASVTPVPKASKKNVKGIVCWGDDLMNDSMTETYSYMAVLQRLLKEKGYHIPVINKTLQGGGTLSMMKMAGVSDSILQEYITTHEQAANGTELYITEKGIRDLTKEQIERNDLECIPVIFMGYYGGWNHDPKELAEQQEQILKTFPDQEYFLVVGTRPVDGSVDSASLDQELRKKWKEHYISLAETTPHPASTIEAQDALAQEIIQKMEELKYIEKGNQVNTDEEPKQTS